MKKTIIWIMMICLLLTGCSWLDGEYHSVTPHAANDPMQSQDGLVVRTYLELRKALVDMVAAGSTENTIFLVDMDMSMVDQYMNTAILHVRKNDAIGAYAVDNIQYEVGTVASLDAVAIDISYIHGRQEILRIKRVQTVNSMKKLIMAALDSCASDIVIRVAEYEPMDLVQFVQDYVDQNPDICMEMPQISVVVYPETGLERVFEISFTYQTSRETLRDMQETVAPIFSAAKLYVEGSENTQQKYEQLYSFLMERYDYQYDTSINPAYSLLRYGVGDSKAFASVYSIMCHDAGISCEVVVGTRNGEAWYWNLIKIDDTYYHLDLLACNEQEEFILQTAENMSGYVWDYSVYP